MNKVELRASWLLRVFGRNPLVRSSDRLEAVVVFAASLVVLVMMPIAGAVGTAVHESQAVAAARVATTRHEVTAVATADSVASSDPYVVGASTPVRWMAGNQVQTAVVHSRDWHKAGETMTIWVDEGGVRTPAPPSEADQALVAVLAAFFVWSTAVAAGAVMIVITRTWLDRRRYARWESEFHDLAGNGGSHSNYW